MLYPFEKELAVKRRGLEDNQSKFDTNEAAIEKLESDQNVIADLVIQNRAERHRYSDAHLVDLLVNGGELPESETIRFLRAEDNAKLLERASNFIESELKTHYRERALLGGEIQNFKKDYDYLMAKKDYLMAMSGGPPSDKLRRRLIETADAAKRTIEANTLIHSFS